MSNDDVNNDIEKFEKKLDHHWGNGQVFNGWAIFYGLVVIAKALLRLATAVQNNADSTNQIASEIRYKR